MNHDVNYGLRVSVTCQSRFINCNKCTTPVGTSIMGEAVHVVGRGIWEISAPSPQFRCELETALKKKKSVKRNYGHAL